MSVSCCTVPVGVPPFKIGIFSNFRTLFVFYVLYGSTVNSLSLSLPRRRFRSVCSRVQPWRGEAAPSHTRAARCAVHRLHTHALSPRARASSCAPRGAVLAQGGVFVAFRAACSRVSACNRRLRSLPRARCIRNPPPQRPSHPLPQGLFAALTPPQWIAKLTKNPARTPLSPST